MMLKNEQKILSDKCCAQLGCFVAVFCVVCLIFSSFFIHLYLHCNGKHNKIYLADYLCGGSCTKTI